jgi:methylmalonyl-CoA/ethylmalonyl-CoA epimerase
MTLLRIDHIAVVVPELEAALEFWRTALGLSVEHVEEIPDQETVVAMLPVGESEVELVQPTTETSGMAKFLAKRGAGLHHICFQVDDIDAALARLQEQGIQLINEQPVTGAGGRRVAFVHPRSATGVLVELVEARDVL